MGTFARMKLLALLATAALPFSNSFALGSNTSQNLQSGGAPSGAPATNASITPPAPLSLAAAARKARAEHKLVPKAAMVFTNDNLPSAGGISVVGENAAADQEDAAASTKAQAGIQQDEKYWRGRFSQLRTKLRQSQSELEIMQRELGELDLQYYSSPMEALVQGYTRSDINHKTDAIDAKKKDIADLQQQLSDLEDQLRQAGGDPGWARE